ncbi:M23 family metallopeptidase [Flavobacterium sp. XGLA_31]|uniref:M23 family metallopeptidase n=1 Tax=Flavobacterium sp. XGLA_31 TaxID=3447666 RepID=UPI003F3894F7
MKTVITFLVLCISLISYSQPKVTVYNERIENGFNILVTNDEFCPVSVKIELDLTNLSSSNDMTKIYVIPAKTKGFSITKLQTVKKEGSSTFKIKSTFNYGDSNLKEYTDYDYSLPFQSGKSFTVHQGYNGSFSHQNENSLDFTMPIGTEILAAREGIVVKVVQVFNQNCPEKSCAEFNNYVMIYHNDGTFSKYVHLKRNGVVVKEGDTVKENDLIGYSGNVGWSNGPHLHFMVYLQRIGSIETLKTKFKVNDGKETRLLVEKEQYSRNY